MKPIELSDLQKSKLLEMCNDLFSQYYNIGFYSVQSNTLQVSETKNSLVFIHWFEFCITILANKIYDLQYSLEVQDDMLGGDYYEMIWNNHPVDFLYEQFKQLK